MPIVVGVNVRRTREFLFADAGHHDLAIGCRVVVETSDGLELGVVVQEERMVEKVGGPVATVLRIIGADDVKRISDNQERAIRARAVVQRHIETHELDMKLTCLEYTFDRSKLYVYYTAENRVDFRGLIKDLGHELKTRIQMVQIGVRDEARMIGGIGSCGQLVCCRRFLKEFAPVSMEMAKEQDVGLNISKISGLCGRLMCCLGYEHQQYNAARKLLPKLKTTVTISEGTGTVVGLDCLGERVVVDLGDGKRVTVHRSDIIQKP